MDARRSARNALMLTKRRRGSKGEPSPGVPPLRAAPAARSLRAAVGRAETVTPGGDGTPPLRGLAERGEVGGGRRKGSSGTPTPTADGKRAVLRIICREIITRPGGGRRNAVRSAETAAAGRRGRRPLQGGCGDVGPAVIQRTGGGGTPPLRQILCCIVYPPFFTQSQRRWGRGGSVASRRRRTQPPHL